MMGFTATAVTTVLVRTTPVPLNSINLPLMPAVVRHLLAAAHVQEKLLAINPRVVVETMDLIP